MLFPWTPDQLDYVHDIMVLGKYYSPLQREQGNFYSLKWSPGEPHKLSNTCQNNKPYPDTYFDFCID